MSSTGSNKKADDDDVQPASPSGTRGRSPGFNAMTGMSNSAAAASTELRTTDQEIQMLAGELADALASIIPICRCGGGRCREGITRDGRVYLKCVINEGFGSCGFFKWVDAKEIAEAQKRIREIAKKQE